MTQSGQSHGPGAGRCEHARPGEDLGAGIDDHSGADHGPVAICSPLDRRLQDFASDDL